MDSVINKKIKVPLHYQIYLDLLKKIQSGLLRPGEKLPSEPELEQIYGVSRITVRGAIEMLSQEGLVEKNRGKKGTIVCKSKYTYDIKKLTSFTDDASQYGERAGSNLLNFKVMIPPREIADKLFLNKNEKVYYIERTRYRQDIIVGLHRSYIKRLKGLELKAEMFSPDVSLYRLLKEMGQVPTTAEELIEVKIPEDEILTVLGLEPKTAVFYKERMTYTREKELIEYVEMFYNAEFYQYKIELQLE